MKRIVSTCLLMLACAALLLSSFRTSEPVTYMIHYKSRVTEFRHAQEELLNLIRNTQEFSPSNIARIQQSINENRLHLKTIDFWLRYLEPISYRKINGPLPVEWETEVFEKYEAPYRRDGAGLSLVEIYLHEKEIRKDSLETLIKTSFETSNVFLADSITQNLRTHQHFFLANRLWLLNLAAIYTTGFECPNQENIIPELEHMLSSVKEHYADYNQNFPNYPVTPAYLALFDEALGFVRKQDRDPKKFDHFHFIRDFVNPLYSLNHVMILDYNVRSVNFNDYSLNRNSNSIFDKSLYRGQNQKGVYIGITNEAELKELKEIGKLLFFDPILSQNNKRSCASCHKPDQFFADTTLTTHMQFDREKPLARNTPSLVNAVHNHLLMMDGKHINLENQAKDVITNPLEMGGTEEEILKKVSSCDDYKSVFKKYLKYTPRYETLSMEHIASAIMLYYSETSSYYSPFDHAIHQKKEPGLNVVNGFNLFMGKAKCGTCHFVPQFNGVKPPYIGSEFEVIGVPADNNFKEISADPGRHGIHAVAEMKAAFRTGTIRNAARTSPYMHNGSLKTLEEVIDFYDAGGGVGKGLDIPNQTLDTDSLRLTKAEKKDIISFIESLTEEIPKTEPPTSLPVSRNKTINNRKIGGEY